MPSNLPATSLSGHALRFLPILFFDADDSLFDTDRWMRNYVAHGYPHKLAEFDSRSEMKLTNVIGASAEKLLLEDATFMHQAKPMAGADFMLKVLDAVNYPYAVCTHRGYHKRGHEFTVRALSTLTSRHVPVYALDMHVSKHEYIESLIHQGNTDYSSYLLVDDNHIPWDTSLMCLDSRRWSSQICVDQKWNREVVYGYARVATLDSVVTALIRRIEQNLSLSHEGALGYYEAEHVLHALKKAMHAKLGELQPDYDELEVGRARTSSLGQYDSSLTGNSKIQYTPPSPMRGKFWPTESIVYPVDSTLK